MELGTKLTLPPGHLCLRRSDPKEEHLTWFYEASARAALGVRSGVDAQEAVAEAARRVAIRYGLSEEDTSKQLIAGEPWEEMLDEEARGRILIVAGGLSKESIDIYLENCSSVPALVAPKLGPIGMLGPDGGDDDRTRIIIWEIIDMSNTSLREKCWAPELVDMRFAHELRAHGGSKLLRLRRTVTESEAALQEVRLESLRRLRFLTSAEQVRRNRVMRELAAARDDPSRILAVLIKLMGGVETSKGVSEEVATLIAMQLRLLLYWTKAALGTELADKLAAGIEVLSRCALRKTFKEISRTFLKANTPPDVLIAASSSAHRSTGEMASMGAYLVEELRELGWSARLVTCNGSNDPYPRGKLVSKRDGCSVFSIGDSKNGMVQLVAQMSPSPWQAPEDDRTRLCRLFAEETLRAVTREGIRPEAIFSCGWCAEQFAPVLSKGPEELVNWFQETSLVHMVEPTELAPRSDSSVGSSAVEKLAETLPGYDGWGTLAVGQNGEEIPEAIAATAPTEYSSPFRSDVGHPNNAGGAFGDHKASREELRRKQLLSDGRTKVVIFVDTGACLRSALPQKGRCCSAAWKSELEAELGRLRDSLVALVDPGTGGETAGESPGGAHCVLEMAMADLARRYPDRVLQIAPDLRPRAMSGADCAIVCDGTSGIKNELRAMGTTVLNRPQELSRFLKRVLDAHGGVRSIRDEVVSCATPIGPVASAWSDELTNVLQVVPLLLPINKDLEELFLRKSSWAFQRARMTRMEFSRPGVKRVELYGSFNDWAKPFRMSNSPPGSNRFSLKIMLPVGKHYYKVVVDKEWTVDSNSPTEFDENGYRNNVVNVQ